MLCHDITAGLFVPVQLLPDDRADDVGARLVYLRPSSLIAIENPGLLAAAKALDAKFEALVTRATSVEGQD